MLTHHRFRMVRHASKHCQSRAWYCACVRTAPVHSTPTEPAMISSPLRLVLTTLCLAVLATQIDTAVVNLAMRPIGLDLEADMRSLQWVLDSYNLAYAALLLTGGLLADLYGRRRTFIAGSAILSIATLMCAAAPST